MKLILIIQKKIQISLIFTDKVIISLFNDQIKFFNNHLQIGTTSMLMPSSVIWRSVSNVIIIP